MITCCSTRSPFTKSGGSTMIEVLVAILVFSIGLLGIATTQTLGLTSTHSSLYRSHAAQLSYEIVDIIRMNSEAAEGGTFSDLTIDADDIAADTFNSNDSCFSANNGCSTDEMAESWLAYWSDRLDTLLPDAAASLQLNGDVYTLLIEWSDFRNNNERMEADLDEDGNADGDTFTIQLDFRA